MNCFVITRQGTDDVDTPVFHAGEEGESEAVAIFTTESAARCYLQQAEWEKTYAVGQLTPVQTLNWFTQAMNDGVSVVTIDPLYERQQQGEPQRTLDLREPLGAFSDFLRNELIARVDQHEGAPSTPAHWEEETEARALLDGQIQAVIARLEQLGLATRTLPLNELCSATAALCCFPAHMAAAAAAWSDPDKRTRTLNVLNGEPHLREAFGEHQVQLAPEHRDVLQSLIDAPRPSDGVVHEFALGTLRELLDCLDPSLAEIVRGGVAHHLATVQSASDAQRDEAEREDDQAIASCVAEIHETLGLPPREAPRSASARG